MGKISRRRNSNSAAASILLISSSGSLSPPLLIQGVHALGSAFSCGSSIREARSCTTLCSTSTADEGGSSSSSKNGAGGASCPSGQKCYAGIECEPSKSMDWILDWQERIERRIMGDSSSSSSSNGNNISSLSTKIRTQQEKKEYSFVCGSTYADVEARCKRATATSVVSSAHYHGVHHCPTGSSSECPASLECYYATVPCSLPSPSHQQPPPEQQLLVVEYHGADLDLPGLPPLVSPSLNILSRLDIDSLTMAVSNATNIITSSNSNMTEEVIEDEHVQEHSSSPSSSWGKFFTESLSGMMMRMSMLSSSSSSSTSSASSSSHSLLRYSSRHDWN